MQKSENGLQCIVTGAAQKGMYFPWDSGTVCAVLTAGFCLLLAEAFPSVSYPWWGMAAAALLVQAVLFVAYQSDIGNWVVPVGIGLLLLLSLALNRWILPGFGTMANDFLTLLTEKNGKIYLDFAAADARCLPLAAAVSLLLVSLLFSRSAWSGRLVLALPVLLPCYGAMLLGLVPVGIGGGLLIAGAVLLMVRRTAAGEPLTGVPTQLILTVLCAVLCLLVGLSFRSGLDTDLMDAIQTRIHHQRYDSDTNSMPEGNLKNLPAWNKSDAPALEVTMEQPEKVYLRGQVYDTYTGTGWKTADTKDADTGSIALTYTVHVQKSDPIQLTIQTTPAEAIVFLTNDLNGKRIVEKNGTYSLTPGASYSYTTTCAGYIGQKVEHYTAPDKDGTLTITLEKAPANGTLINFDSAWPHLRQNNENNGVVDYRTPVYAKDAELYWATSIGSGYDVNACGCPILVDGAIYTYSGSRIYKVDAISGEILIDKPMDHNSSFAINPPTYANGMIFVGLSDGTIQAFDANTLNSLWIYRDSIGGQPNSSIVYHDGYIYTGFWVGEINEAHYVCLSATDEDPTQSMEEKLPTWYYTSKGGFYWAGAYVCDDFLLIGTDDGASGYTTGRPSLLSFNPKTGELLSSYKMNVTGDIRSSITHYNGKYYFTSKRKIPTVCGPTPGG